MPRSKKKYAYLMHNKDLKRWSDELSRSSEITADTYLRRLGSFCKSVSVSPDTLLSLRSKEITDAISDEITSMENRGLAGSYIMSTVKAVKSWLTYNNVKLTRKLRVRDSDATPTLRNERVPTQDELKKIFESGDPRATAACALMAHTGMRPEVIGNYKGNGGLKISDFSELQLSKGKVEFLKIPTLIVIRSDISKAKHQYLTFLGDQGCRYLKAYIEKRINEGEVVTQNSPVVVPAKMNLRNESSFIRTINIGDLVRQAIRNAGFLWRPYVLRAYFDTQLMMAESKGLIMRDFRTFFMGHKGDIENRYTTNKHRLPDDLIENMRQSYSKSLQFLETEKSTKQVEKTMDEFKMMLLMLAGYTDSEIQKGNFLQLEVTELSKKIDDKRMKSLNNGHKQRVIGIKDVEPYIERGWEFVSVIPGEKAIVKLPE